MPKTAAIHQPESFPWLGFLDKARQADVLILLDNVQFEKNYFQNRNKIRTAQGWTWITLPVVTEGRSKQLISEVEISRTAQPRWREKQLASWSQNYRPAPFGAKYMPFLEKLYAADQKRLADFNGETIAWLFEQFEIRTEVLWASKLKADIPEGATERLVALCRAAGADRYLSGVSGKEYLDDKKFEEAGISVSYQEFHHPIYKQRFEPFIPALTSLDLLFNKGPESATLLSDAKTPRMDSVFL